MKIEVTRGLIEITLDAKRIQLSDEEARDLYSKLKTALGISDNLYWPMPSTTPPLQPYIQPYPMTVSSGGTGHYSL